jgi:MFS family permease
VPFFRRIPDRNIWLVDGAIFLLGLAYGLSISVLALFLRARGMSKEDIGSLAVWFALGIVALSLPMDALIRRFSARVTLIASLVGYAAAVTVFPYLRDFPSMAAVRFFDGACSVGVWVSCETILLSRADKDNKANVTSLYAVAMALGYVIGPLAAKAVVALASRETVFLTSGVLGSAAAIAVLLRLDPDVKREPAPGEDAGASTLTSAGLLYRIKTSCFATFAYGYFQASVVLFLPVFLTEQKGITENQTIAIPAFFALGMLLFSNVAGRISDRHGHLLLMRLLASVGTTMILGFVFLDHYWLMCGAVFVAGATLASISPVSLALQGVIVAPADYSRSNAIYNVFYAAGMLLGPFASSRIFAAAGGAPMLYHLAALWTAFVIFTIVFARDDPAYAAREARQAAPVP